MSKLLQPFLIALVMTALGIGYQVKLNMASNRLAKAEANLYLLRNVIEQQNQSMNRIQQARHQAELLLKAQGIQLQQLATDTKEKQHAVQQHLAKAVPGRPNCNAEPLPAAVISLLGTTANRGAAASANIATRGANTPLP